MQREVRKGERENENVQEMMKKIFDEQDVKNEAGHEDGGKENLGGEKREGRRRLAGNEVKWTWMKE